jgi:GR25 family glycosyltransferase involved in LPS biosynthesis
MNFKAWVINLDHRPERFTNFQKENIPFPVERFSAMNLSCPKLACISSHIEIMKRFENDFINIIFEDDCIIVNPWDAFFHALKQLPADWDCLYLGAMLHKKISKHSANLFNLESGWCTHAIAYNGNRLAKHLINKTPSHINLGWNNIDTYLARAVQPIFKCFLLNPMIAIQSENHSDITNSQRKYPFFENFKKYTS